VVRILASDQEPPRRTRRGEERDGQLRARATELFLELGYDGVSLDDVVREVGGSKTNIYNFYGGKAGLFNTVMAEMLRDILLPLQQMQLAGLDLEAGLRRIATTLLGILLRERHLSFQRLVIAEALRHPQIGSDWHRHGPMAAHAVLEAFLSEQQRLSLVLAKIDTRRAAVLFHDMVAFDLLNRAMMKIDGGPTPAEVAGTIEDAVAMFVAALENPAGRADRG
jgi:AcrR family transcriptional regulator